MAKEKTDTFEPDQIKNAGFSKDTDKKMKRQATAWEKYLQNIHVIKNLYSERVNNSYNH